MKFAIVQVAYFEVILQYLVSKFWFEISGYMNDWMLLELKYTVPAK